MRLLQNIFRGEALRFYNGTARREITLDARVKAMTSYFKDIDKQQRVKADLLSLNLKLFSEKEGSIRKGLGKLASYISERALMCPPPPI